MNNQLLIEACESLKRQNILINERHPPQPTTQPICVRSSGIFSTEKKSADEYLNKTLYSSSNREEMLRIYRPTINNRTPSQSRDDFSFKNDGSVKIDYFKTSYGTSFTTPIKFAMVRPVPYPDHRGW